MEKAEIKAKIAALMNERTILQVDYKASSTRIRRELMKLRSKLQKSPAHVIGGQAYTEAEYQKMISSGELVVRNITPECPEDEG